jgi:PAS domain S-box-containing protein
MANTNREINRTKSELFEEIKSLREQNAKLGVAEPKCKEIEDELEKYRAIFECTGDIIIISNADGKIIDANSRAVDSYGYSRRKLLSMNISDLRTPEQRAFIKEQLGKGIKNGNVYETVHKRNDGSTFPVEVSSRCIKTDSKQIIVSVVRNISERKKAEETRNRLASIVEYSDDALINLSLDGTVLSWNHGAERLYGFMANEAIGKNISIIVPKDRLPEIDKKISDIKKGKTLHGFETVRMCKEGKLVDVSITASPIKDVSGAIVGVSWTAHNITDRKKVERALELNEARYRAIFEQAAIGIDELSLDGRFLRANQRLCDILGYQKEELYQKHLKDITYPSDLDYNLMYLRRLIAGEISTFTIEKRAVRKDGAIVWLSSTVSLVHDAGKPKYFIGIIEDITDRRRIQDALKYSEERFHAVYDHAAMGIIMVDKNGIIIDANTTLIDMLGYSREEIVHRSIDDIIYNEDIDTGHEQFKKMVDHETDHYKVELRYQRKDGSILWVRLTESAVRISSGELYFGVGMVEDITERIQKNQLLLSEKLQSELYLDVMSHDINNLNQIAMGYLELAQENLNLNGEQKTLINKPLDALRSSTTVINNVKKLRNLREREYQYSILEIGQYLETIKSKYSSVPGRKAVIKYNPDCHCYTRANELLEDVFSNIVINAIKHSKDPVTINIKLEKVRNDKKDCCKVTIEDNGPGIPSNKKCELFERFTSDTNNNSGTAKKKGTGLGLYIVKTLVEDFNGKVWIEDRVPGDYTKGTKVIVMLPAVKK